MLSCPPYFPQRAIGGRLAWQLGRQRGRHFNYSSVTYACFQGDLPFAILQTVTLSKPFDASTDPALAQAYICVFMVIYLITAFP